MPRVGWATYWWRELAQGYTMRDMSTPMDRLATIVARLTGKTITECYLVSCLTDRPWPARLLLSTDDGHHVVIDVGMIDITSPDGGMIRGMDERHAQAQLLAMGQGR